MTIKSGKSLDYKALPRVLILFGEEEFLIEEAFKSIVEESIKSDEYKFNFDLFDAEEIAQDQLTDACEAYPMMSGKRVVAVRRLDKLLTGRQSKTNPSKLIKYLLNPAETTVLIATCSIDKSGGIAKLWQSNPAKAEKKISTLKYPYNEVLAKHEWIEFPKVWDNQLPEWVISRFRNNQKTIVNDALQLFLAQINPDLREISSEIDKIISYVEDRKQINIDDISKVIGISKQYNVFELQKAISRRDTASAINIAGKILKTDKQEVLIITILTRFFKALWKLVEADKRLDKYALASLVGVSPFFLSDYTTSLNYYHPNEIDSSFSHLAEADLRIKSTSTDGMLIIEELILKLTAK